ncbi:prolyl oligopeptidase [Polychytrium aggregatum]|uniref:prolyl oligopeptidase n=1 Tax=Polychytrium aggregatum TaxID=110093 RepID=UPI0022FE1964|nr:prolyl oligopeptidase [Polychytrium aggregatum]KAI9208342.1 prolyl oligopeptidase [Polychytrium aggregatum]
MILSRLVRRIKPTAAFICPKRPFLFPPVRSNMSEYPAIRRDESVTESLHGNIIKDPYRWLEDPDAPETVEFVNNQNTFFQSIIAKNTWKETFRERLTKMFNYERFGCPFKRGDSYYYFHNSGLQAQSVLYKQDSLTGEPKVFFDPNTLSEDGTVSLNTYSFSESGDLFAYALSASGSDWVTIHVKSTKDGATGEVDDPVHWAKFTSIEWTHDEKGYFYTSYPKPENVSGDKAGTETNQNTNAALYYHRIGKPQSEDVLIWKDPEHPQYMPGSVVSDDGKYLIVSISESCDPANLVYYFDLEANGINERPQFVAVKDKFEYSYSYITNEGSVFYFTTTDGAPKRRVVKYDINNTEAGFIEVVPERDDLLEDVSVIDHNKLVLIYLQDVKSVGYLYSLEGSQLAKLPLPVGVIVSSLSSKKKSKELFYSVISFLSPGVIYRYDVDTLEQTVFRQVHLEGFDDSQFETKQVFYPSKDGTKIPMFIISRKGIALDGSHPALLYGYGGFNISVTPTFNVTWLTFIQNLGGVVAVANIRGGGEYGEEKWYNQGKLFKKQNCFDDFQHAAKHLVSGGYTTSSKLIINGGSNGGLLIGACVNQAPELFGVGIADVGVMDVVRFHKFTIGHAWVSDYGNPDKKEDLEYILSYSPLHNVQSTKPYPAVLLCTSDHDDRVVPLHSYKLIAELQHTARNNPQPLCIRIETKAGHGAGMSTKQRIDAATDKFAFAGAVLGLEWRA